MTLDSSPCPVKRVIAGKVYQSTHEWRVLCEAKYQNRHDVIFYCIHCLKRVSDEFRQ